MAGGGEDGHYLLNKYILGLKYASKEHNIKSVIITGSCMSEVYRNQLFQKVTRLPN